MKTGLSLIWMQTKRSFSEDVNNQEELLTQTLDFWFMLSQEKSWISHFSSPCQPNLTDQELSSQTTQLINKEAWVEFFDRGKSKVPFKASVAETTHTSRAQHRSEIAAKCGFENFAFTIFPLVPAMCYWVSLTASSNYFWVTENTHCSNP